MKLKKILVAIISVILALALFAGCAKPTTMATVTDLDGNPVGTVSFDEYLFWAYYNYAYYQAYYESYYYYFQKYFHETLDDIFDPEAEEKITVNEYLTDSLVKDLKQQFVILKLFDEYGLTFGTDEITNVGLYYNSMISNYGEAKVKKIRARLGMNETQFKEMLRSLVKISSVQEHLFGDDGIRKVTDQQVKDYFLENYIRVKHVYIGSTYTVKENDKDVKKTRTEAEMQALVDQILAEYNANPTIDNFLKLVEKYSEDTGSTKTKTENNVTSPDLDYCQASYDSSAGAITVTEYGGYTFIKDYASFNEPFVNLAGELETGKAGSCKVTSVDTEGNTTVTGMHVILKTDLNTSEAAIKSATELTDNYGESYLKSIVESDIFMALMDEEIAKLNFTFDEELLKKYSMKNLKKI